MLFRDIVRICSLAIIGLGIGIYLVIQSYSPWFILLGPIYIPSICYGIKTFIVYIIRIIMFSLKSIVFSLVFKSLFGGIVAVLILIIGCFGMLIIGPIIGMVRIGILLTDDYKIDHDLIDIEA